MRPIEFRLRQAAQPLTDRWQQIPVARRGSTLLGISFRPLQAAAFGLDVRDTLRNLVQYPFQLIRLGAYWNQMEPEPGVFDPGELDWQVETAEQSGKQIILCVGPLKTFGYPEFFVPGHHLEQPFPEHSLIEPTAYSALLVAATEHLSRVIERYKSHKSIVAWQLEHEAVDPLGIEHSWRLDVAFVEAEVAAIKIADPDRPVLMNGFLPASWPVRLSQWWNTRDQGDSLASSQRLADMIGIDYYPRNALLQIGAQTLYLDGSRNRWQQSRRRQLLEWAVVSGKKLLITEGQAEPWETATTPPNPSDRAMYSCGPENVISNYNDCMAAPMAPASLYAYIFWGAEYWWLRKLAGDSTYVQAFTRILTDSAQP